jgi:hypothetical protein
MLCTSLSLFICIMGLSFSNAFAQQSTPSQNSKKKQKITKKTLKLQNKSNTQKNQKNSKEITQTKGGQVIEFKQLSVEGTVQRPSAAYLLQRRKLKFKGLTPKKSFIPKILESVKKSPF